MSSVALDRQPASSTAGTVRVYSLIAALAFGVALVGGWATEIGPWYRGLKFPPWRPPNWLFAPAWTTIFALLVVSAGLAWTSARTGTERRDLVLAFGLNAVMNMGWSLLFFRYRRPDWALAEVCGLWLSVALAMVAAGRIRPMSGWLLAPYLAWVSFASVLNAAIVRLNAPF
jgi:benzodiazapine receptor